MCLVCLHFVTGKPQNLRPNSTIKHSCLRYSFKVSILTKYNTKLRAVFSFNNAITAYLITKPEQGANLSLENNYNTASDDDKRC